MIRPKWIKVGRTEMDLFEVIDSLRLGKSIDDIADAEAFVTTIEIRELLMRTSHYLKSHLILDSYLETVNRLKNIHDYASKLEWSANEIRELVNLHLSGAEIENIAQLMRKDILTIQNKLYSLNLRDKGVENG